MGLVGFLQFALKFCIDFLAWPLFALGCPLYASIRAIESNSNSDMRNLVAYWILFSLISLFELAFVRLIEWLPFWPYIKLITICWLVLPHFDGACYVYEHLVRPCLSLNPQVVINQFSNPKKGLPLTEESFLAVAERYVKENGLEKLIAEKEALEKLITEKSKNMEPKVEVEEIRAVANTEEKETAAAIHSKFKEPNVAKEDAKAVEQADERNPSAATEATEPISISFRQFGEVKTFPFFPSLPFQSKFKEPNIAKENAEAGELKEKTLAAATEWVKCAEPNLAKTAKNTVAAEEIKEKTVVEEKKVLEIPASEKVQKEWICAVCQVKTSSKRKLNSHLRGTKHKAKCEELKASKQAPKNKGCSSSTANQEPKKSTSGDRPNQSKPKRQEGSWTNQSMLSCGICNVKCPSEKHLASHLTGKKHASRIQEMMDSLGKGHC